MILKCKENFNSLYENVASLKKSFSKDTDKSSEED